MQQNPLPISCLMTGSKSRHPQLLSPLLLCPATTRRPRLKRHSSGPPSIRTAAVLAAPISARLANPVHPTTVCCSTQYSEATLSCVPDAEGYREALTDVLDSSLDIGICSFTGYQFARSVRVDDNTLKVGTFVMVCNLNNGGQCGHPFCDSMMLSWTGISYYLFSAVSATKPYQIPLDGTCPPTFPSKRESGESGAPVWIGFGASALLPEAGTDKSSKAPKAPAAAAAGGTAYYKDGPTTYYEAPAVLYAGPVTITSTKYDIKYQQGNMNWVDMAGPAKTIPADEATGKHLVKPYTFILQVKKPREQY